MPLFQLPFHVRSIEQGLVAGLLGALMILVPTILADRQVWPFRPLVELFMALRMGTIAEPKRFALFKKAMYFLTGILLVIAIFYGLVWIGVIANGPQPPIPTVEEFIRMQREKGR